MSERDERLTALLEELRALRLERDRADTRFLVRLMRAEREEIDMIFEAGYASFSQFLKSEALTDAGRYDAFKRGVNKVGVAAAHEIGSAATIEAGRLQSDPGEYVQSVNDWKKHHGGTLPTRETARTILRQVDPRKEVPAATRKESELAQLRAENKRLKAEIRSLQAEIKRLKKEQEAA